VPSAWRGARVDPGRPGALALVIVAVLAAVLATIAVWRSRPVAEPAPPLAIAGAGLAATPPPAAPPPVAGAALVVSVAGKVRHPGLVRLPDGSRVADAIAKAGGPLRGADLTMLNLARRVTDGEQILVGLPQPPPGPGAAPGGAASPAGGGKVDLNRATLEQLDALPGIGPVTAQRILDWRAKHGRFASVDQLREVEGIGERRFGQLRMQVTL
jgi:competence protein ComEA